MITRSNVLVPMERLLMWNIEDLELNVQQLLAMLKFLKDGQTPRSRSRVKSVGIYENALSQDILMWNLKDLSFTAKKLLVRFFTNYRTTEWQTEQKQYTPPPPYRGLKRVRFAVNIDSCSILEISKVILRTLLPKYDKNNTFILANLCPKLPGRGRKELLIKCVWETRWQLESMQKLF